MNRNIISNLQSIEISHSFALNYNHGVELNGKWDFFEPTRFVYAFFALNMIYSIDWELSLTHDKLIYQKNSNDNHAKNQIESLIEFINFYNSDAFETALDKLDSNRELYSVVLKMESDFNSSRNNSRNSGKTISQDFLISSEKYSNYIPLLPIDHFDLLQMSYAVRNNLFHGEKKAHKMKEQGHRNRLFHYGNIILATNESFFVVMKENHNYRRMERWEVQDNM